MHEYRDTVVVSPSVAETAPMLAARNVHMIAAMTLTIGMLIWASVTLR